jgi:hypothetical protein
LREIRTLALTPQVLIGIPRAAEGWTFAYAMPAFGAASNAGGKRDYVAGLTRSFIFWPARSCSNPCSTTVVRGTSSTHPVVL